jgi:hypothetical protein
VDQKKELADVAKQAGIEATIQDYSEDVVDKGAR